MLIQRNYAARSSDHVFLTSPSQGAVARMLYKHLLRSAILLGLAAAACGRLPAQQADWAVYNGGLDGDHYSKLTQINRANVHRLQQAWRFDTGEKGGMQTNPLIVGRTLYAYTPTQKVIALDAATGKLKWKFDSGIHGTQPARGLTYLAGRNRAKRRASSPG